jgi:hypothetical protein
MESWSKRNETHSKNKEKVRNYSKLSVTSLLFRDTH